MLEKYIYICNILEGKKFAEKKKKKHFSASNDAFKSKLKISGV